MTADGRVPPWQRGTTRPRLALEVGVGSDAALRALAEAGSRGRLRTTPVDDRTLRLQDRLTRATLSVSATEDGVGGSGVEVTLAGRDLPGLRARAAEALNRYVEALESAGTRVRVGMWRDLGPEGGEEPVPDPEAWTAEGARLGAIAASEGLDREASGGPELGRLALAEGSRAWADELATACGVEDLALTAETARTWIDGLVRTGRGRFRQPKPAYVVDALLDVARVEGVLRLPEPGVLRLAHTERDAEGRQEVAWGWGFKPAATSALTLHARHACTAEQLETEAVGGAAVVHVLGEVLASLAQVRPGPVDELRCW
ncbi:hypothetical protein J4G33_06525 [Actinotalea sp. BY-33]|uniref:Uncharacterized protein n=1 Tax=Actinotalea soli TaxID=2819234 RepID=A0A939LNX6_9CELL|nr:hypothetical protein [Actinotalea soli]MBO1751456.1 hypothetical protein [Actinotalea soli]